MDPNYNNSQNDFLWTLLANPADDAFRYNYNLQRLVNDFPQSGILQALLAHTSEDKNLRQASVYFNARSLYKLINSPSSLTGVPNEKIIFQNGNGYSSYIHQDTPAPAEENYFSFNEPGAPEAPAEEQPAISAEAGHHPDNAGAAESSPVDSYAENTAVEEPAAEIPAHEQLSDIPVAANETNTIEEIPPAIPEAHAIEAQPEVVAETHETPAAEIQEEPANETPAPGPIINYAAGLGHRMPADEEFVEDPTAAPGHEEVPVEEHATSGHGTDPSISYEHSVEENIHEPHLPPPVPEEALTEVHPIEADLPSTVYEPVAEHLPPPVPAEALAEAHPADAELPPAVPVEEQPAAEHHFAGPYDDNEPVQQYRPWNEPEAETHAETGVKEEHIDYQPAEEHKPWEEPAAAYQQPEVDEEHTGTNEQPREHQPWEEPAPEHHEPEPAAAHTETANQAEEHQPWEQPAPEPVHAEAAAETHDIEEETFDEIAGIEDFSVENDILSNAVAADYFGFDRTFGEHKTPVPEKPTETPAPEPVNEHIYDEQQDLSKYHDEKMPYSFLWWLDKTRKEHAGVYQPYATPAKENVSEPVSKAKSGGDELQQQYYENIFHITSVEELDKSVPVPPQPLVANPAFSEKKKEQVIIDSFIQEEPQIRPQSSDKLDNENKAKKSSEDRDELVSETLAAIYSDQMLYHKAIASYKK